MGPIVAAPVPPSSDPVVYTRISVLSDLVTSPPNFTPGLALSHLFYREAVLPLLEQEAPGLVHCAARLGSGSEVLGFDTPRSADHEWGPRLQLFLPPEAAARDAERISTLLSERLPKTFRGFPTHFEPTGEPGDETAGVGVMRETDGPVRHRVDVADPHAWFTGELGFAPFADGTGGDVDSDGTHADEGAVSLSDWLATPTQRLAEVTAGAVFHDGFGYVTAARAHLAWYPPDVWRYVLACQWQRIAQEEAFVGRCGEVGDELGSAVVAARIVRDLMRLVLLQERRYPPYGKWLGSAFAGTAGAAELTPSLTAAIAAADWHERERNLVHAYESVAASHNALGLSDSVDPTTRPYHGRPFMVLHAERFAEALVAGITDPYISSLPLIGAVDQHVDSTDLLSRPRLTHIALRAITGG